MDKECIQILELQTEIANNSASILRLVREMRFLSTLLFGIEIVELIKMGVSMLL